MPSDRVLELARARGIRVDFDLTAPGPLWAMARPAPDAKSANHFEPAAREFGQFVLALGRRYSGTYVPAPGQAPIPRVDYCRSGTSPTSPAGSRPSGTRWTDGG